MKKNLKLLLFLSIIFLFVGCQSEGEQPNTQTTNENNSAVTLNEKKATETEGFDELVEKSKGSTVTFYGWGGDEKLNQWIDEVYSKTMKEKYDIKIERVPMDIDQILSQLSGEIQNSDTNGIIDMIWINGENFKSAKENNMLYGPFTDMLPNYNKYIDKESDENKYDFGYPIEGYEAPYGKAQVVFVVDGAVVSERPKNSEEFLEFAKKYKGKVTYPALPDFTGSVFVRNIIAETCDYEKLMEENLDKAQIKEIIDPAIKYLVELNKYLWNEGKTFPATSTQQDNMFIDGELVFNVTYDAYGPALKIQDGSYSNTVETFQFENGTIGNTNFIAISANSPNKAGALLAINEMLSPEMQASRYENLKVIPVLDNSKMNDSEKSLFSNLELGKGAIPQDELLSKRISELPAYTVPVIEEIWLEEVVGK